MFSLLIRPLVLLFRVFVRPSDAESFFPTRDRGLHMGWTHGSDGRPKGRWSSS